MLIGELAGRAGLSSRQVRYYTNAGLLSADRELNGYRSYQPDDVERAQRIHCLLALELTVEQVRRIAPCWAKTATTMCEATRQTLTQQMAELDHRIAVLSSTKSLIQELLTSQPVK